MFKTSVLTAISLALAISQAAPTFANPVSDDAMSRLRPPIAVENVEATPQEAGAISGTVVEKPSADDKELAGASKSNALLADQDIPAPSDKNYSAKPVEEDMPAPADNDKKQLAAAGDQPATAYTEMDKAALTHEPPTFGGTSNANGATKIASFVVGSIFGTPIAMVRSLGSEIKRGCTDLTGGGKNPVAVGVVGVAIAPYSVICAVLTGPFYSVTNAYKGEPFTKDAFSLGEHVNP